MNPTVPAWLWPWARPHSPRIDAAAAALDTARVARGHHRQCGRRQVDDCAPVGDGARTAPRRDRPPLMAGGLAADANRSLYPPAQRDHRRRRLGRRRSRPAGSDPRSDRPRDRGDPRRHAAMDAFLAGGRAADRLGCGEAGASAGRHRSDAADRGPVSHDLGGRGELDARVCGGCATRRRRRASGSRVWPASTNSTGSCRRSEPTPPTAISGRAAAPPR